jgi:hypothetical protein
MYDVGKPSLKHSSSIKPDLLDGRWSVEPKTYSNTFTQAAAPAEAPSQIKKKEVCCTAVGL